MDRLAQVAFRGGVPGPGCSSRKYSRTSVSLTGPDSNHDSNSSGHRLIAATGDSA